MRVFKKILSLLLLITGCSLFSMMASCAPDARKDQEKLSPQMRQTIEKLRPQLIAMDGKKGVFEGVLFLGAEASAFGFCTKEECPDDDQIGCHIEFSDAASQDAQEFFARDGYLHMWVSGTIHTGAKSGNQHGYGHYGLKLCKLTIEKIISIEKMNLPRMRSKIYPDSLGSLVI